MEDEFADYLAMDPEIANMVCLLPNSLAKVPCTSYGADKVLLGRRNAFAW